MAWMMRKSKRREVDVGRRAIAHRHLTTGSPRHEEWQLAVAYARSDHPGRGGLTMSTPTEGRADGARSRRAGRVPAGPLLAATSRSRVWRALRASGSPGRRDRAPHRPPPTGPRQAGHTSGRGSGGTSRCSPGRARPTARSRARAAALAPRTTGNEIVAICRRDNHKQTIAILELPLPDPTPDGAEWIETYRRWRR
jgi:hypothetical protein